MLRPYLSKAPFTAWHEFKLLDRKMLTIAEGASQQFTMPNGRNSTLTFLGHSADRDTTGCACGCGSITVNKHRVLDTTFVLDEGGVVLHVGQHHDSGILIVGVSCKTQN